MAYTPSTDNRSLVLPQPAVLAWRDVCYTVRQKKEEKVLLNRVSGIIRPSTITALMGPSGAGKTTLLDVLAGRKTGGKITGDITVNGHPKEQRSGPAPPPPPSNGPHLLSGGGASRPLQRRVGG